jgi:methenyltetrahydromethanopterin cyclohydrolase
MISVNRQAIRIVDEMIAQAEQLGIAVTHLSCGARVVDLGLNVPGSLLAGKYAAEASLGGMGRVSFLPLNFGDFWLPGVGIEVDQAEIGCMAAQYAGWGIRRGDFFAIGSGPARAQAAVEPLFKQKMIDYVDQAEAVVLVLEGHTMPNDDVGTYVARKCQLPPDKVTLIIAPAASFAGSIQICARAVATGMHKMLKLGFDVRQVLHGYGTCPIAPVVPDEDLASARLNDCVLYGARVHYTVRANDDELQALISRIPSAASPDYGTPCHELFVRYGNFYNIDPLLFCPSEVSMNNLNSGRTFRAGRPNPRVLWASLLGESAK